MPPKKKSVDVQKLENFVNKPRKRAEAEDSSDEENEQVEQQEEQQPEPQKNNNKAKSKRTVLPSLSDEEEEVEIQIKPKSKPKPRVSRKKVPEKANNAAVLEPPNVVNNGPNLDQGPENTKPVEPEKVPEKTNVYELEMKKFQDSMAQMSLEFKKQMEEQRAAHKKELEAERAELARERAEVGNLRAIKYNSLLKF